MTAQTTTRTRKSRAERAAEKAAQDQQPKPEQCPHDLDPATCAECNGSAAAERQAGTQPEAEPKPDLPLATGDLGAYQLTYHKPTLTLPDGTTVGCDSRWGHEQPKAALACLRKLAADHGVRVEAPE